MDVSRLVLVAGGRRKQLLVVLDISFCCWCSCIVNAGVVIVSGCQWQILVIADGNC